jgi:hypothetical protein
LERPRCQIDYFNEGGSRTIAYGLASRGAAHLRRVANIPFNRLDWTTRNRSIKRLFLQHALMISDIMVALELTCRQSGTMRLLIEHEIPLPQNTRLESDPFRWTVGASRREKMGVIPDCVFAVEYHNTREPILGFLEADRGTMPVIRAKQKSSSIARKLIAYCATWKSGIHRSRFGISRMRVVIVTTGIERCCKIQEAMQRLGFGRRIFLASTATDAASSDFLDRLKS